VWQITLNGDWYGLLERASCGQKCNVNNEDATAAAAARGTAWWGECALSCNRQRITCAIADFATGHGLEDLLSNALLARFIKVSKICRPKVLPLRVLRVTLLPVLAHLFDVLGGIIQYPRIILVKAQRNLLTIQIVRSLVWSATAKARVPTTSSFWDLGRAVRRVPTSWRVLCESLLCLAGKGSYTNTCPTSNECLR
jgi:hypothetical protein